MWAYRFLSASAYSSAVRSRAEVMPRRDEAFVLQRRMLPSSLPDRTADESGLKAHEKTLLSD